MRLLQHRADDGVRAVIVATDRHAEFIDGVATIRALATRAIADGYEHRGDGGRVWHVRLP